jgi:hypothetical protein
VAARARTTVKNCILMVIVMVLKMVGRREGLGSDETKVMDIGGVSLAQKND